MLAQQPSGRSVPRDIKRVVILMQAQRRAYSREHRAARRIHLDNLSERLEAAGVSWKVYEQQDSYGCNMLQNFKVFLQAEKTSPLYSRGMVAGPEGQFEYDAMHGEPNITDWRRRTFGDLTSALSGPGRNRRNYPVPAALSHWRGTRRLTCPSPLYPAAISRRLYRRRAAETTPWQLERMAETVEYE